MTRRPSTSRIYSYDDINQFAETFLKEHRADEELPAPIEEIIEFDLGIDIAPFPGLQKIHDIDGFMAGDLTCIYVDDFIYHNRFFRYRYTLAHEVGHYVIHKDQIGKFHPNTLREWKDFVSQVDPVEYD